MPRKTKKASTRPAEPKIFMLREQRVVLDADLARLYEVTTKVINQAVKRNAKRFPEDFAFQLRGKEEINLKSQIVTSSLEGSHGGRRKMPWVFTEHGALMAANILRSERAVDMSIFVVRAFMRLREQIAANHAVLKRLAEIDKTLLQHDGALHDLYRKLLPLLQPPPDPSSKRRLGFQKEES